jgi:hypothetical protein
MRARRSKIAASTSAAVLLGPGTLHAGRSNISVSKNLYSYTLVVDAGLVQQINRADILGNGRNQPATRLFAPTGPEVARQNDMSFATVVDRVRLDFVEMPEMELTLPQAVRLWSLGMDDCRYVIDSLVDAGFLAWTPKRTIVRSGRDPLSRQHIQAVDISVAVTKYHNKSVSNK